LRSHLEGVWSLQGDVLVDSARRTNTYLEKLHGNAYNQVNSAKLIYQVSPARDSVGRTRCWGQQMYRENSFWTTVYLAEVER
jgi:hypothetical protein